MYHNIIILQVFSNMTSNIRKALFKALMAQSIENENAVVIDNGEEVRPCPEYYPVNTFQNFFFLYMYMCILFKSLDTIYICTCTCMYMYMLRTDYQPSRF